MRPRGMTISVLIERIFLAVALAAPIAVSLWHDVFRSYLTTPDADVIYIAQALHMADGLSQTYFDHPAYFYILALQAWLKLFAFLGLAPEPSLALASTVPDIDGYMQPLVVAGRWFSAFFCSLFVWVTTAGLRRMGVGALLAAGGAVGLGLSQGVAVQSLLLRAEMMSAAFVFFAYFALVAAARTDRWRQILFMMAAGFSAFVALGSKVQAIIPLIGVPFLALTLPRADLPVLPAQPGALRNAFILFAAAASVPIIAIVGLTLLYGNYASGFPVKEYHVVFLLVAAGTIILYGWLNRIPPEQMYAGTAAVVLGLSIGGYLLFLRHEYMNLDTIVHPVDHMLAFTRDFRDKGILSVVLGDGLKSFIAFRTDGALAPIRALELGTLVLVGLLAKRGQWRQAIHVVSLLGIAFAIEIAFNLRGYRTLYFVYTEPWILIAFVIGLERILREARGHGKAARGRIAVGIAGFGLWSAIFALQPNIVGKQPPGNVCSTVQPGFIGPRLMERYKSYCLPGVGKQSSANNGRSSAMCGLT